MGLAPGQVSYYHPRSAAPGRGQSQERRTHGAAQARGGERNAGGVAAGSGRAAAGLAQPLVLVLITGLMGALVLVSLAGARRTDTAVPRFLAWSGPAVLLLANAVAAIPARTAARTRPAVVLRTE